MEEKRGSLPISGQIDFILDDVQLNLLKNGLINKFLMDAIISWPDNPSETKKKIKLIIESAESPGSVKAETSSGRHNSNFLDENTMRGISRAEIYMMNRILIPKTWILFGRLQGDNPLPIIIMFYVELNFGTYSFKKDKETLEQFNFRLN
jgi:hypothetical protein